MSKFPHIVEALAWFTAKREASLLVVSALLFNQLVLVTLQPDTVRAQSTPVKTTDVVYVNGIRTTDPSKDSGSAVLSAVNQLKNQWPIYAASKGLTPPVNFSYQYIHHVSTLVDLLDATSQLAGEGGSDLTIYYYNPSAISTASDIDLRQLTASDNNTHASQMNQLMLASDFTYLPAASLASTAQLASALRGAYNNTVNKLAAKFAQDNTDLNQLVSKLEQSINNGHRAVCLGHSQGNFFCNLAYQIIQFDYDGQHTLKNRGLTLPDENVLVVAQIATPASFTADGRFQYVKYCRDVINMVPNSLNENYKDPNDSTPCMPRSPNGFADTLTIAFRALVGVIVNGSGIPEHDIMHYLDPASGQYQKVMEMIANTLSDPGCNGDTNCYLKEDFRSGNFENNWTQVKFPYSVSTGTGLLAITSEAAGQ